MTHLNIEPVADLLVGQAMVVAARYDDLPISAAAALVMEEMRSLRPESVICVAAILTVYLHRGASIADLAAENLNP